MPNIVIIDESIVTNSRKFVLSNVLADELPKLIGQLSKPLFEHPEIHHYSKSLVSAILREIARIIPLAARAREIENI